MLDVDVDVERVFGLGFRTRDRLFGDGMNGRVGMFCLRYDKIR